MQKEASIRLALLSEGWEAFSRIDVDDESHVTGFDILKHVPDGFCVVRYVFENGIGYELTYTTLIDEDEVDAIMVFYCGTRLRYLTREDFGYSESGYAQTRVRAFLDRRYLADAA